MRIEFLKSSPSFLVQIFAFLGRAMRPKLANSLLRLGMDLLPSLTTIPAAITGQLLWAYKNLPSELRPAIVNCLSISIAAPGSIELVTAQDIDLFMRDFQAHRQLFDALTQSPHQGLLSLVAPYAGSDEAVARFLSRTLEERQFADLMLPLLPIGGNFLGLVYRPMLAFRDFWPRLVQSEEFYVVAAELIACGQWQAVCPVLNSQDILPELLRRAGLGRVVARAFERAQCQDDLVVLAGTVHAIAKVCDADEFVALLPKLWRCLGSGVAHVKGPVFVAIAAIERSTRDAVDWQPLRPYAEEFATSSVPLERDVASDLLQSVVPKCHERGSGSQ
jgi:hypothetical protein